MPTPKLWSKLENVGDVTSPQLGTGGAEIGSPTYEPARFGNGILSDVNDEGCTFPTGANSINLDKGTIEFWAKLNFDPSHAADHALLDFRLSGSGGMRLIFINSIDDFRLYIQSGGSYVVTLTTTGVSWNAGDLLHFAITWDRTGTDIGDSKTAVLYIDDVEEASSTTQWDTDTVNSNLYVGTSYGGTSHSDAVIDNIKTYDECKIDFSDRNSEGDGPPAAKTLVQATLISILLLIVLPTLHEIAKFTGPRV